MSTRRHARKTRRRGDSEKILSARVIKKHLTTETYTKWLKASFYSRFEKGDDWDPATGSCGAHAAFVEEELGFLSEPTEVRTKKRVTVETIDTIIDLLNEGVMIDFIHNYKDYRTFSALPKDNRYGNHEFQILKGGDTYFVTQGFLHAYKHSLVAYSEREIREMLHDIITKLSDYESNKKWGDLELGLYKKYFKTDFFMYPKRPVLLKRPIHGVELTYTTLRR
jgi:hypothetical protein